MPRRCGPERACRCVGIPTFLCLPQTGNRRFAMPRSQRGTTGARSPDSRAWQRCEHRATGAQSARPLPSATRDAAITRPRRIGMKSLSRRCCMATALGLPGELASSPGAHAQRTDTLKRIAQTGTINLGHRESSVPASSAWPTSTLQAGSSHAGTPASSNFLPARSVPAALAVPPRCVNEVSRDFDDADGVPACGLMSARPAPIASLPLLSIRMQT